LISAAFIENVREPGSRQRGVEPESFALPWSEPPRSPAAMEDTIATAWELLLERWNAVRNELPMMDVSPVHTSPPPAWAGGGVYPELAEGPPPFVWDERRRAGLRAELDAIYAHLYGLTREELAYILDTFPIVRRKEEAQYGEYRTKRMGLEKYEEHGFVG
jgi:hypothetical protein